MIATILFGFPTESLKLTSILEVSKRVWLDDGGTSDRLHSSGIHQQTSAETRNADTDIPRRMISICDSILGPSLILLSVTWLGLSLGTGIQRGRGDDEREAKIL